MLAHESTLPYCILTRLHDLSLSWLRATAMLPKIVHGIAVTFSIPKRPESNRHSPRHSGLNATAMPWFPFVVSLLPTSPSGTSTSDPRTVLVTGGSASGPGWVPFAGGLRMKL
jgi:hypothetical protein